MLDRDAARRRCEYVKKRNVWAMSPYLNKILDSIFADLPAALDEIERLEDENARLRERVAELEGE